MTILNPLFASDLARMDLPPELTRMATTLMNGLPDGQHARFGDILLALLADIPDDDMDDVLDGLYEEDGPAFVDIMEGLAMVGALTLGAVLSKQIKTIAESN